MCQFEAGDVREPFGGHLSHYIDSTNRHLRRNMLHQDVRRRGCTRVEISLYACDTEDLSQTVAEELIAEALELVNTEEGLFVVQPHRKAMGKPRSASGPMHVAGRPHTWGDISRMERPQQDRQSAGGARQTYSENGCR